MRVKEEWQKKRSCELINEICKKRNRIHTFVIWSIDTATGVIEILSKIRVEGHTFSV